jgi:formylglycine-generating enzyme required for sulfatase activity
MKMKMKWLCLLACLSLLLIQHVEGQDSFTNSIGMKFVYVKPGTFMMGSSFKEMKRVFQNYPFEKELDERPHQVTLTEGFYIQATEVTQHQWKEIMGTNPSSFVMCGDTCPVENVSWEDVQLFIQKLNVREKTTPSHNEYMLPTEAQWEYACRAGSATPFTNGKWIGLEGDLSLNKVAWYSVNSFEKVHPVATKNPNKWGLYDMHGNVLEWCSNSKYRYPSYPVKNPPVSYLDSGSNRVYRGGSWNDLPYACRSAYRKDAAKDFQYKNLGFRLIKRGHPTLSK